MNLMTFLHDFLFTVKFIFYSNVWSSARVPQYDLQYKHCSFLFCVFLSEIYIYIYSLIWKGPGWLNELGSWIT